VVVGFQLATVCNGPGIEDNGRTSRRMKVIGNSAANAMRVTPSGVATTLPRSTPIQIHGEREGEHQGVGGQRVDGSPRMRHPMMNR